MSLSVGWECESRVPTGSSLSWEPCLFADNHKAFLLRVVGPTKGRLRPSQRLPAAPRHHQTPGSRGRPGPRHLFWPDTHNPPQADYIETDPVGTGPTKGRLRLPVRGYEGRTMYTEGVYIRVIGLAPEHDTTPPKADLTKIQPW